MRVFRSCPWKVLVCLVACVTTLLVDCDVQAQDLSLQDCVQPVHPESLAKLTAGRGMSSMP